MVGDGSFLVDATFLLRASEATFFGAPLLVDKDGRDHTRSFGVVRDLLRLRRALGVTRGLLIFGSEETAKTDQALLNDLVPLLKRIGLPFVRDDETRVIDLCAHYAPAVQHIVSSNRAMMQFVTSERSVFLCSVGKEDEHITEESIRAIGIRSAQVPALLALSEGKDAPLTRKQAVRLLELHGTLDAALADASAPPAADWKRKLALRQDDLRRKEAESAAPRAGTTQLTPMPEGPFVADSKGSADALREYGFWSLVRLLPPPATTISHVNQARKGATEAAYTAVRCDHDLAVLERRLKHAEICGIDTETIGKDPRNATLLGVSLSIKEGEAFFVPMIPSDLDGLSVDQVRSRITKALSRKVRLVGHNLKYDLGVLHRHGIEIDAPHFDTMLAAYTCFGDWDFWNLAAVTKKVLGHSIKRYRDIVGDGETFLDKPFKELLNTHAVTPTWHCASINRCATSW
ncbi:MAG: hypothetical protein L0338_09160 [Acidobacteria bacterium]|nr:hypothetical protein [Acidobacteriota bacterium]